MKAVTKYKLQEGLFIIVFFFLVFVAHILLSDTEDIPVFRSIVGAIFLGSITAWYEIKIAVKLQKKMNTLLFILFNLFFYYVIFSVMLISYAYVNLIFKMGFTPSEAFEIGIADIYPIGFNAMVFYLFIFLFILQLIRQIRRTVVKGLTKKYLSGRLNQPISETRIFLFMDLLSSTAYAEKLGHQTYSCFIKEIYSEFDEYILTTKGSLYQFVGDQVVVVWNLEDGLKNNNAARFFYLVEAALKKKEKYFIDKYGIAPTFKAGLHYGEVAITEVGNILKREIAYHGDAVNTTARICSLASEVNERILVSEDFIKRTQVNLPGVNAKFFGRYNLKGKKNGVNIYKLCKEQALKTEAVNISSIENPSLNGRIRKYLKGLLPAS